ncbi:hypothetical protein U750_02415 [Streptococcus pseudopneumoniae G42]|nr:hypothetical protein U750_02415 [Streptococcus pseudopneumoniae G42]
MHFIFIKRNKNEFIFYVFALFISFQFQKQDLNFDTSSLALKQAHFKNHKLREGSGFIYLF